MIVKTTVHVISRQGLWAVFFSGALRAKRILNKPRAIRLAKKFVDDGKADMAIVHKKDATVSYRYIR